MSPAWVLLWGLLQVDPQEEARRLGQSAPTARPVGQVKVALQEGAPKLEISLRGSWNAGGHPAPAKLVAQPEQDQVHLSGEGLDLKGTQIELQGTGLFCLDRRCYRGSLRLQPWGNGLLALNLVGLEDYLLGVVPGEIGRKLPWRFYEAARAQAVVARTYTIRSLGQYQGKPWDLRDDVRDQVYEGALGEDSLCSRAVVSTRGVLLVDAAGNPVDAYYHSASGGRTADIVQVWPHKEAKPYLRGVADTAPDGRAWSGASSVGAWKETWDSASLHRAVRRDLSEALGRPVDPGPVHSLRLEGRDSSGRARRLVVVGADSTVEVVADRIRWALRRPVKNRSILRSSRFELHLEGGNYVAEGTGNGHGVGLSQNGAMGRAWAGQNCGQILQAYYPGTKQRNLDP